MNEAAILCVDDEVSLLRVLELGLRDLSIEVITASSGQEGLKWLEEREIAVVLSDQMMPEMNGIEFLGQVRERWPDTFRIMLTAYADLNTVMAAVNEGEIHRFLTKPWRMEELKMAIGQGMERHTLIKENQDLLDQLEERNRELQGFNQTLEQRVEERTGQLRKAYGELIDNEKLLAVGRLVEGLIHEVLDPLTVVEGRIEMLMMDTSLSDGHQKSLNIAKDQILRAVQIMNNLRDFSKQRPPEWAEVDVNGLLTQTLDLVVHEVRQRGIQVEEDLARLPGVQADQDQLYQVFLNLIGNAIDAMQQNGRLTVRTRLLANEGASGTIEVDVEDTGPGISEENLKRIFDPFFTTKDSGTGLGLSICQGIVENHGGKIAVQSGMGTGTRFLVWLPLESSSRPE